ncbi:MAG TPA: glycoside hydrolase family 2 protein [Polyangia bacterium]|nr:glycoside hydrolase family 2 protein [Polyangia bacterium]
MTPRAHSVTGHRRAAISAWQACATPPGAIADPAALERAGLPWMETAAPATAAAAARQAGFSLDGPVRRFDAEDWWFRAKLPAVEGGADAAAGADAGEVALVFEGIATVADVWLDGAHLLASDDMFIRHERRLGGARAGAELVIRCRALEPLLASKRPRPRWRAPMIEHQQLRWFRTTLLGRTPGWSPPAPVVGPWLPVRVERRVGLVVEDLRLDVCLRGERGRVDVDCRLRALGAASLGPVQLVVERAGRRHAVALTGDGARFAGSLEVPDPERWWPHTHGEPACYEARLVAGDVTVGLGRVGFREIVREEPFALRINSARIFCRGACWTPLDVTRLQADRGAYAAALTQARDAGMNLLRVGGTMVYERDDFYELADELGILIWQDFMFANMDYPEDDPAFLATVVEEATQQLGRLQGRPSLAVLCGNSEGEQQAAMWGAPRERWSPRLFHEVLADLARAYCPGVPYWPSSAHGGAFPHEADVGTTSYYGVGAYLRPLDDARRAEVKFATECLAFANVPEPRALPGGPSVRAHHAAWKARTPRDLGAGWDFDDVRDHYLERLMGVDARDLRTTDHDRYLALGRVVTGEVMAQVFGEWRRARSTSAGGLVWFLRDLWPSAGWGVVDVAGAPKAAYYALKRAFQPVALHVSDEGGNGLALHLCNERPEPLRGELELALYRAGEIEVGRARRPVELAARETLELSAAACFDGFLDLGYAYRFGPPPHDLVAATLRAASGEVRARAFHFPLGLPSARERDVGLRAEARPDSDGAALVVGARRFAQSIAIDAEGFEPDDAYFHLAPGEERTLRLRRVSGAGPLRGTLQPLNAEASTKITIVGP